MGAGEEVGARQGEQGQEMSQGEVEREKAEAGQSARRLLRRARTLRCMMVSPTSQLK